MNVIADTNILVRLVMEDDAAQTDLAIRTMAEASSVAISPLVLCELAWVLGRGYAVPRHAIANAIRSIMETRGVLVDRPAAEAGLAILEAGGDFADGVIAYQGRWLGGETFVSFDRKAVRLLDENGVSARLLTARTADP
ncbi:type II toxin-antitoxin system VapC family toxin [Sphingomonas sp. MMS24-J13]|uniref:type II toxin-antitoxin system VapC family toxin n=1 Tax=Sphingomonas sp. MMS24-J13 TaxID=3238686 RepID=UPI00384F17D4